MTTLTHIDTTCPDPVEARLSVHGTQAFETVERIDSAGARQLLHAADFPVRNLGAADRGEYLRVMTTSVLAAEIRAQRLGITLALALDGRVTA